MIWKEWKNKTVKIMMNNQSSTIRLEIKINTEQTQVLSNIEYYLKIKN